MNTKKMKIYAIPNPCFLADTFVYAVLDDDYCKDWMINIGKTIWVKLNSDNKIEEFGFEIDKRMHNLPLEKIISESEQPTTAQKRTFLKFDNEFWGLQRGIYDKYFKRF